MEKINVPQLLKNRDNNIMLRFFKKVKKKSKDTGNNKKGKECGSQ